MIRGTEPVLKLGMLKLPKYCVQTVLHHYISIKHNNWDGVYELFNVVYYNISC